ncbi:MAG: serine--tRNA ligase [Proteobacteria bacterium]|nr:serine--tRNA ligase [Pseudomonadota bacterium]
MFDIKWIRDNPEDFDRGVARRGLDPAAGGLIELDKARRRAETRAQEIKARRNKLSKEIGAAKAKGEDADALIEEVSRSKDEESEAGEAARKAGAEMETALAVIPNLPAADVPDGPDAAANLEVRRWGNAPALDFQPREHFEIGEALGQMDFERAARMSGARFVILRGALARMERALAAFMLDLHTSEHGYTEINPPALVRDEAVFGTGQLPKFGDDLFQTKKIDIEALNEHVSSVVDPWEKARMDGLDLEKLSPAEQFEAARNHIAQVVAKTRTLTREALERGDFEERYWMIPTAEVPLTNMVAGEIVDEAELPERLVAMTWCFRSEAGAAGKDTRGMIRQHQFTKVEMVSITKPEDSDSELEHMTDSAEEVLKRLVLPYRTVVLSTGDMGFAARKTYDIEVWLPGQNAFREISSCSNCGDFQARRMMARCRPAGGKGARFVHTLNGSGLAVGRTLIAILENYQRADGSVGVPEALRPYMGGLEAITPAP